jgi:hypothetical protein
MPAHTGGPAVGLFDRLFVKSEPPIPDPDRLRDKLFAARAGG